MTFLISCLFLKIRNITPAHHSRVYQQMTKHTSCMLPTFGLYTILYTKNSCVWILTMETFEKLLQMNHQDGTRWKLLMENRIHVCLLHENSSAELILTFICDDATYLIGPTKCENQLDCQSKSSCISKQRNQHILSETIHKKPSSLLQFISFPIIFLVF